MELNHSAMYRELEERRKNKREAWYAGAVLIGGLVILAILFIAGQSADAYALSN